VRIASLEWHFREVKPADAVKLHRIVGQDGSAARFYCIPKRSIRVTPRRSNTQSPSMRAKYETRCFGGSLALPRLDRLPAGSMSPAPQATALSYRTTLNRSHGDPK
jgi:hypothetical protein